MAPVLAMVAALVVVGGGSRGDGGKVGSGSWG